MRELDATILLCTLAAAVGLPIGYFLGWVWEEVRPYLAAALWLLLSLWGFYRVKHGCDQVVTLLWDYGLQVREEPYLDTEPMA